MMPRPKLFSRDEQINMILRAQAGESIRSIARDYDTCGNTVKRYISEQHRLRNNARVALAHRIRRRKEAQCPAS